MYLAISIQVEIKAKFSLSGLCTTIMSSSITWLEVGAWPGSRTSLESLQIPASDRGISSHTENVGEPDLGQR